MCLSFRFKYLVSWYVISDYPTLTLMLSMNLTMLNPLFGRCTLIDPVLTAGAAAAPLPLSAISVVDLAEDSPGVLLP